MKKLGKYEIIEEIGAGGMALVYRAKDTQIGRTVAIKVMSEHIDKDHRRRFYQEARAIGSLKHPNIITIHDLAEEGGSPYIVMEYLDGIDLAQKMDQGNGFSLSDRLRVAIEVARGLDYAHAHEIIHRDIKPSNIRILSDGSVKIMDFGIARFGESKLTKTGLLVGTWRYMSPEQITGEEVDRRVDIWSVGVVLYEMVAGHVPFESDNPVGLAHRITQTEPMPFATLGIDVPDALSHCVMRALSKNPTARHTTAEELAAELESIRVELGTTDEELESEVRRDAEKYLKLSRNLIKRKKFDRATEAAGRALTLDPNNAVAQQLLREMDAERERAKRNERALRILDEGRRALLDGRIDDASASIEQVSMTGTYPHEVQRLRGELDKALSARRVKHGLGSARTLFDAGDFSQAHRELEKTLTIAPNSTEAKQLIELVNEATARELRQHAEAALERGDYDHARLNLERHLRDHPDDRELQTLLTRIVHLQDGVSVSNATIVQRRADEFGAAYAEALAAEERGDFDRALELARGLLPQPGADSEMARLVARVERAIAERSRGQKVEDAAIDAGADTTDSGPKARRTRKVRDATSEEQKPMARKAGDAQRLFDGASEAESSGNVGDVVPLDHGLFDYSLESERANEQSDLADGRRNEEATQTGSIESHTGTTAAPRPKRKSDAARRAGAGANPGNVPTVASGAVRGRALESKKTSRVLWIAAAAVVVALAAAIWLRPKPTIVLGSVWIDVAPWAEIQQVRHAETGKTMDVPAMSTPCRLELPAGDYIVDAMNPHYPGGTHSFEIEVHAGRATENYEILPGFEYDDLVPDF